MKKITLFLFALVTFTAASFAQANKVATKDAAWPEMKAFHDLMSATFHPAEEGNFAPLKAKVADLYRASKVWVASDVPAQYKTAETKEVLEKLMIQCHDIWAQVDAKASNAKLKTMITYIIIDGIVTVREWVLNPNA
jgi:hypothetical protein